MYDIKAILIVVISGVHHDLHQAAPESAVAPLPLLQQDHSKWSLETNCGFDRPSLANLACAQTWQPGMGKKTTDFNSTPIQEASMGNKRHLYTIIYWFELRNTWCFWIFFAQSSQPHYSNFRITHKAEAAVDPACLSQSGVFFLRI